MLDKAEEAYLRILRAIILLAATLLIFASGWFAVTGLYKVSRSPDSVTAEPATVSAEEIVSATFAAPAESGASQQGAQSQEKAGNQQLYADFAKKYYHLFQTGFEGYRRKDDKALSLQQFAEDYLFLDERRAAIAKGELDYTRDLEELEGLFTAMSAAAAQPETVKQLKRYREAKMVQATRKEPRIRIELRREWDRTSMGCRDWFYEPRGCQVEREVQVPYTETVTSMALPEGVKSHTQIFGSFQARYFTLLSERKEANADKAEAERMKILAGNAAGSTALTTAMFVFGAFLLLMFFFLLIAIERHQRRMCLASGQSDPAS